MELAEIEKLLEKYFEGNCNLQEEAVLQSYFVSSNVAPHLDAYRPLFQYFSKTKTEEATRPLPLKTKKVKVYQWVGAAAAIIIAFGVFFGMRNDNLQSGLIDDPEIALIETQKVLNLISTHLNRGTDKIAYLQEFENTTNKILKND